MSEPQIFKNQDAEFRARVREHPRGRVVNMPNLMLHTPQCDHIGDLMTKSAKACLDGENAAEELKRWAQKEKGNRLLLCETCEV